MDTEGLAIAQRRRGNGLVMVREGLVRVRGAWQWLDDGLEGLGPGLVMAKGVLVLIVNGKGGLGNGLAMARWGLGYG